MKLKINTLFGPLTIVSVMVLLEGVVSGSAVVVYSNNFDSGIGSLNGLSIVDQTGSSMVSIDSGQLRIDSSGSESTFLVANTSSFGAPYSSILKNNPGTVTWAFNVSNQDGPLNNGFFFSLASDSTDPLVYTSSSYLFFGGVFVGNAMEFDGVGPHFPSQTLLQIPSADGLGPLPSKGSFRITYNPSTDLWSVYGQVGLAYVDPTTVTTLLGSFVDSTLTRVPLQYMAFGGQDTGSDFFDNISVSVVVPEPSTIALALLATALGLFRNSRQSGSLRSIHGCKTLKNPS